MGDMLDHVVAVLHEHLVLHEVDVRSWLSLEEGLAEVSHVEAAGFAVSSVLPIEHQLRDEQDVLVPFAVGVLHLLPVVATTVVLCGEVDGLHEVVVLAACQELVVLELAVLVEPHVLLSEVSRLAQWPLRLAERAAVLQQLQLLPSAGSNLPLQRRWA